MPDRLEALDEEVEEALRLALELLDLELGIVSRIVGDEYQVLYVVAPPDMPIARGERLVLPETYCSLVYERDGLVTIDEMGASPHRGHPAYAKTQLESYIGVPLRPDGERSGTLNFSSRRRRAEDFGPIDRGLVTLVASWIERSIERGSLLAELQRSNAHFHAIFDKSGDPLFLHRDGRFLDANAATARLLGVDEPEALRGQTVLEFLDDPGVMPALAERRRRLERGETLSTPLELTVRTRAGERRYVEALGVPVELEDGVAAITVARDITDRKRAETQMLQSERLASIGSLAAGVAHELNNPLAYVLANLDVALEELGDGAPPTLRDALEEAREGAERARLIVRDLRTFSRLEEERRAPCDVHRLLDLAVNLAHNEIRHRAELVKDYGEIPHVDADEGRLTQVFVNLLLNAAQAIEPGHASEQQIRVETRAVDGAVQVVVRDTGSGIDPDVLPRLFDAFVSTKPVGEGMGLGLALCHSIVESHGGTIGAENGVDGGAVFTVALPATDAVERASAPAPTAGDATGARGRVLVIDDDEMVRRSIERLLRRQHEVDCVGSGEEALERLSAEGSEYDVLLCDLMMPEMPGWQLFEVLQEAAPEVAERMVFITGGTRSSEGARFVERVPNPCLEKPFDVAQLRGLVDAAVTKRRSG